MSRGPIELENTEELSPALAELTQRERLFVSHLFTPNPRAGAVAKAAGYCKGNSKSSTFGRIEHRLKSRLSIAKAIAEECRVQVKALGPAAIAGAREIIADKGHKDRGKMIRH